MQMFQMNKTLPTSDQELARSAAEGDRAAFEAVVLKYSRPLAEFAAGRTNTFQDAEDIVQETFLRAFVNLKAFDARYSLKNWLFTIAYRLIISGYRKKRLRLADSDALESVAAPTTDAPPMDWLWEAAMEMGPEIHTVLWLRYKQDMNILEIASVMKKTKIGVRVLLHRARRRLAERINTRAAANDPQSNWARCRPVFSERTEIQ